MVWSWFNWAKTESQHEKTVSSLPLTSQYTEPASPPAKQTPKTREEEADAELQAFLEEINYKPTLESPITSTSKSSDESSLRTSRPETTGPSSYQPYSSISPAAVYPSKISCRAAFDAAYYCQLPGGQFVNVYRYGSLRDCRPLWSDFWFCMRTNRGYMTDEERAKTIKQHYWERDRKYREGPSSEDVWEMRKEAVKGAFEGDLKAAEEEEKRKTQSTADRQDL